MLFADVTFTTEGIVIISGLLVALSGAVIYLHKQSESLQEARHALVVKALEDEKKKSEQDKKSYQQMTEELIRVAEIKLGAKIKKVAPVVPEHSSPETPEQKEDAKLATMRAQVTAISLAEGMPARPSEGDGEKGIPVMPVSVPAVEELKEELKAELTEIKTAVKELPEKVAEKIKEDD